MHIKRIIGNIALKGHGINMNKRYNMYNMYNKYKYGISGIMAALMTYNSNFKHYKIVENEGKICSV